MKKFLIIFILICLIAFVYKTITAPHPMVNGPTGEKTLQSWPVKNIYEPVISVTFLPGPNKKLDVVYNFASPVYGFQFTIEDKLPRKDWWHTSENGVTFLRDMGYDYVKFDRPKSSIRFKLDVPHDILNRTPSPIRLFKRWGAIVKPHYFKVKVIGQSTFDEFSTGYPEHSIHMFRMVSPYPILEDESAETMRSDKRDNLYVYETQSRTLMSSSNAKPITREGYTLLIDSGFPKRTQRNIETSTAKAIAYFNDVFDEKSPIHFTIAVTRSKRWHTNGWVSGRHTVMALSPATQFMRQWDKSRSSYIILHEIAHLYQGLHPINQSTLLIEGGATAMAYTAEYEQGYINKYVFDLKWHNAQNRCIKSLNKQNSQSFDFDRVKKEHKRLHYDCGAVLFHYIILAHPGLTPYELWKRLHYTNAHSRFSLGVRVAIALDEVYVPNTLFLNELDAFIKDPISDPSGSLNKLKTLATHSAPLTHSVH